jgi:hypothetical protein
MVQDDVRGLCGVAQSNGKVFPGKFVACFAIALGKSCDTRETCQNTTDKPTVGDRFSVREDQERLRQLWYACERSHGFPPTATIKQLEESWGWSGE